MRGIPGRKLLIGLLGIFVAAVVPAIVLPTLVCGNSGIELSDLGPVTPFALTDERGLVFTEEGFRGHPTIVNFVFTRCDTICPVTSARMEQLQHKLSDRKAESIKLVSISVDPGYDTPPRLAVYAERFHARPEKWRFLTGDTEKVRSLVEGPFMNSMMAEGLTPSGAPQISHNGYFVLVDADLVIRGVYDSNDIHKLDELMHHARYLARMSRGYKFGGG